VNATLVLKIPLTIASSDEYDDYSSDSDDDKYDDNDNSRGASDNFCHEALIKCFINAASHQDINDNFNSHHYIYIKKCFMFMNCLMHESRMNNLNCFLSNLQKYANNFTVMIYGVDLPDKTLLNVSKQLSLANNKIRYVLASTSMLFAHRFDGDLIIKTLTNNYSIIHCRRA